MAMLESRPFVATEPQRPWRVVLTTAGSDEQAETLARALVERRLAGCVNVVRGVCSVYRWKGEVVREDERLLVIKTSEAQIEALGTVIRELHSYETPEMIVLPVAGGDAAYLDWLGSTLGD